MITRLAIENFKGIGRRFDFEVRPITLFFGPNSAGKSSVLHALLYAREVFERKNYDADRTLGGGTFVDLGGFASFVHGRDRDRPIGLTFELDLSKCRLPRFEVVTEGMVEGGLPVVDLGYRVKHARIDIEVVWSPVLQAPYAARYSIVLNGEPFATIQADLDGPSVELTSLDVNHEVLDPALEYGHEQPSDNDYEPRGWIEKILKDRDDLTLPIRMTGQGDALPESTRNLSFPFLRPKPEGMKGFRIWDDHGYEASLLTTLLTQFIVGPVVRLREALTAFRYLGPLREPPPRQYEPPRSPDPGRWPSGLAAWDLLSRDPSLVEAASEWLSGEDRLNAGYGLELFEYKELPINSRSYVRIADTPDIDDLETLRNEIVGLDTKRRLMLVTPHLRVQPPDVGVGISQLVPVLGLALASDTGMAAVEQPELHLHPRLQAELGDLFIEASRDGVRRFLLETHSEHLILRIQRRIRESVEGRPHRGVTISPDDVAIYYSNPQAHGDPIRRIDLDERGEFIQPWPDDFFEIDFYERFSR